MRDSTFPSSCLIRVSSTSALDDCDSDRVGDRGYSSRIGVDLIEGDMRGDGDELPDTELMCAGECIDGGRFRMAMGVHRHVPRFLF